MEQLMTSVPGPRAEVGGHHQLVVSVPDAPGEAWEAQHSAFDITVSAPDVRKLHQIIAGEMDRADAGDGPDYMVDVQLTGSPALQLHWRRFVEDSTTDAWGTRQGLLSSLRGHRVCRYDAREILARFGPGDGSVPPWFNSVWEMPHSGLAVVSA